LFVNAIEILEHVRDTLTVRRVFGEPIERDGVLAIPVACVRGGFGGGAGEGQSKRAGEKAPTGWGGGGGMEARPVGVYVIRKGDVQWRPAVDVNRVVLGAQLGGIVALLVVRSIIKTLRRRRR